MTTPNLKRSRYNDTVWPLDGPYRDYSNLARFPLAKAKTVEEMRKDIDEYMALIKAHRLAHSKTAGAVELKTTRKWNVKTCTRGARTRY